MPYIPLQDRARALDTQAHAGELNFAICSLLLGYIHRHGLSYQTLNDCLGALSGAEREFYRRTVVPYEEQKKKQNGDLYWEITNA